MEGQLHLISSAFLPVPYWSLSGHVAIAVLILPLRSLLFPSHRLHTHPYFPPVNEFLCSFLWVVWSLECMVISHATSTSLALATLFLRMIIAPYIFKGACVNPAYNVFTHLRQGGRPRALKLMLQNVLMEVLAMVCAVLFVSVQWRLLAQFSSQHQEFLIEDKSYMLNVTPLTGFLEELFTTFIALLPVVLMGESFLTVLVSASLTMCLIPMAEAATGGYMNPLNAMASAITFHMDKLTPVDYIVHIVVYWLGPYLGSGLAAVLHSWTNRLHKPKSA